MENKQKVLILILFIVIQLFFFFAEITTFLSKPCEKNEENYFVVARKMSEKLVKMLSHKIAFNQTKLNYSNETTFMQIK